MLMMLAKFWIHLKTIIQVIFIIMLFYSFSDFKSDINELEKILGETLNNL